MKHRASFLAFWSLYLLGYALAVAAVMRMFA